MVTSMTGFAAGTGALPPFSWSWELRSVNAKGLDLRLRVPDWIEGLETQLRSRLGKAMGRGNVTLSLRLHRDDAGGDLVINEAMLDTVLSALTRVEQKAKDHGLTLAETQASDLLTLRGVLEQSSSDGDNTALCAALVKDFDPVLTQFLQMRSNEGRALFTVLTRQIDDISDLVTQATQVAEARREDMTLALQSSLQRVTQNADGVDEQRIAQELALIAVKADVTEELDRLKAHIDAARALLEETVPIGRKLDFLMQEFNREANTLCSKSQHTELTRIGLDLKTVIDQMREQVQNVE